MAGTAQSGLAAATSPPGGDDHDARMEAYRALDRLREARIAQLTDGLSPAALTLALFDWSLHMCSAPRKTPRTGRKGCSPDHTPFDISGRGRASRPSTGVYRAACFRLSLQGQGLAQTAVCCLCPGLPGKKGKSWLVAHSLSERIPAPEVGAPDAGFPPICDAPGTYVFQK